MYVPFEQSRELEEGGNNDGNFFEKSADPTKAFYAAEEVFDFVPPPVVAALKGGGTAARVFGRDADASALAAQAHAKVVGVEALGKR